MVLETPVIYHQTARSGKRPVDTILQLKIEYQSEIIRGITSQNKFWIRIAADAQEKLLYAIKLTEHFFQPPAYFKPILKEEKATPLKAEHLDFLIAEIVRSQFKEEVAPALARDMNFHFYEKLRRDLMTKT